MPLAPGTRLGPYEILAPIGAGGMGEVYRAKDTKLKREAALKVLPDSFAADPDRMSRFQREAQVLAALNHPNIVTIYDIDACEGVDFIAMEYVSGRTLDRLIPRHGMKTAEFLRCAVQIADALAAAHAAGIVHRDLKPGNIMVADSGLVKVLDFGLAKLTEKTGPEEATETMSPPLTEEGQILGTVAYMSPEQAQGLKLDARSDIFSFGAVLYEMLTGRRAFSGDTNMSTLAAILNREPQPLAATTPRELNRIVTRCLRKDPARRLQTMADLKVALEELKEESESGRLEASHIPVASRRIWPLAGTAIALAAIVTAGAWWLWSSPGKTVSSQPNLRQLTYDAGDTGVPALSPDAKLVAYQSDRAEPG
ncbi:MAG: serine/threonine-protein kinase, partial [Bryobacteraceae bacterium]